MEVSEVPFPRLSKATVDARAGLLFQTGSFHRGGLLWILIAIHLLAPAVVHADTITNAAATIQGQLSPTLDSLTQAAASAVRSDWATASSQLDLTLSLTDGLVSSVQSPDMVAALGKKGVALLKSLSRFQTQLVKAKTSVSDPTVRNAMGLKMLLKTVSNGQLLKTMTLTVPSSNTVVLLNETRSSMMALHYAGDTVKFHVNILGPAGSVSCGPVNVTINRLGGNQTDLPILGTPIMSSPTDFSLALGPDAGTLRVTVTTCNQTNSLLLYNFGVPRRAGRPLPPPQNLEAPMHDVSIIGLTWIYGGTGAMGVKIERSSNPTGPWYLIGVTNTVVSYTDTGLNGSTTYYYRLRAYNQYGYSAYSDITTGQTTSTPDVTPPSVPGGLNSVAASISQINLSWDPSTDTGGSGVAGYHVYQDGTQIANVSTINYSATGLTPSTLYCFTVAAYDNAGNDSAASSPGCATTLSPPSTLPAPPSNLAAMVVTPTYITLNWQDNSNNELGFQVQRASSTAGPWSVVGSVGANVTSFTDSNLTASTTYYYKVNAFN